MRQRTMAQKVPEATALFWIIKILTTGMGETTSDFMIHRVGVANTLGLAVVGLVTGLAFAWSLVLQLRADRYVPWTYWLVVVLVGVFGTMAADGLHVVLGVPYLVSTLFFSAVLAAVFAVWFLVEHTLSIHSITTTRRELFYWAVVIATFALGTAAGDMTAMTLKLGYFVSVLLFAVLIAIPALAYAWLGLNAVVAFWAAYVVTRPLGASFADLFASSPSRGGLGLGYGWVSLCLGIVIAVLVGWLSVADRRTSSEAVLATVAVRTDE